MNNKKDRGEEERQEEELNSSDDKSRGNQLFLLSNMWWQQHINSRDNINVEIMEDIVVNLLDDFEFIEILQFDGSSRHQEGNQENRQG
ncbi:hypothetical protein ABK040_009091 [Willaertia magna]